MHQLLKSLFLRLDFDKVLQLRVRCRSLAVHISTRRDGKCTIFELCMSERSVSDLHVYGQARREIGSSFSQSAVVPSPYITKRLTGFCKLSAFSVMLFFENKKGHL